MWVWSAQSKTHSSVRVCLILECPKVPGLVAVNRYNVPSQAPRQAMARGSSGEHDRTARFPTAANDAVARFPLQRHLFPLVCGPHGSAREHPPSAERLSPRPGGLYKLGFVKFGVKWLSEATRY